MPGELLLSRRLGQAWAALREEGSTVELHYQGAREAGALGDIFLGRVTRVLPGIQAAFLEVGLERGAFLHGRDLLLPGDGSERAEKRPIQDRLKEGRDLLVQVVREASGTKGPRVTCQIGLAGRYLVYVPLSPLRAVSRRIEDPGERARLEEIVSRLAPAGGGLVVRTAGRDADETVLAAESGTLAGIWREIERNAARLAPPALLHSGEDLLERILRDAPRGGLDLVLVDDPRDRERAIGYLEALDPELASRVRLHTGPAALLEAYGVDREIERALAPKVWLPCGGFLVIQETEALVAVDVNSGKFLGKERMEETALRMNLEAALEIARQLRLRDLGGIVVVDFIDMESPESRTRVLEEFRAALRKDRARIEVLGFTGLGLVQLARQRRRRGLAASVLGPCPGCSGLGRVRAPEIWLGS